MEKYLFNFSPGSEVIGADVPTRIIDLDLTYLPPEQRGSSILNGSERLHLRFTLPCPADQTLAELERAAVARGLEILAEAEQDLRTRITP